VNEEFIIGDRVFVKHLRAWGRIVSKHIGYRVDMENAKNAISGVCVSKTWTSASDLRLGLSDRLRRKSS
jgi:hypothetical protein